MASRILVRKRQFLAKLLQPRSRSISSYIFTSAAIIDPWNVSIIQQCRMLENITGTNTLQSCLENHEAAFLIIKAEKKNLYKRDYVCLITKSYACLDSSSFYIASVAKETTWSHLWDLALDRGYQGTKQLQRIIYNMGRPIFGTYSCPICNTELMKPSLWFIYLCEVHSPTLRNSSDHLSLDSIIERLQRGDEYFIFNIMF